jgi:hypothetical protein
MRQETYHEKDSAAAKSRAEMDRLLGILEKSSVENWDLSCWEPLRKANEILLHVDKHRENYPENWVENMLQKCRETILEWNTLNIDKTLNKNYNKVIETTKKIMKEAEIEGVFCKTEDALFATTFRFVGESSLVSVIDSLPPGVGVIYANTIISGQGRTILRGDTYILLDGIHRNTHLVVGPQYVLDGYYGKHVPLIAERFYKTERNSCFWDVWVESGDRVCVDNIDIEMLKNLWNPRSGATGSVSQAVRVVSKLEKARLGRVRSI